MTKVFAAVLSAACFGLLPDFLKQFLKRNNYIHASMICTVSALAGALTVTCINGDLSAFPDITNEVLRYLVFGGALLTGFFLLFSVALSAGETVLVGPIVNLCRAAVVFSVAAVRGNGFALPALISAAVFVSGTAMMECKAEKKPSIRWVWSSFGAMICLTGYFFLNRTVTVLATVQTDFRIFMETLIAAGLTAMVEILSVSFVTKKRRKKIEWKMTPAVAAAVLIPAVTACVRIPEESEFVYGLVTCMALPVSVLAAKMMNREQITAVSAAGLVIAFAGMIGLTALR